MKLTKEQAIDLSIELWEWMAESGTEEKSEWPKWADYGVVQDYCFLCEYCGKKGCDKPCPIDSCHDTYYLDWLGARDENERKKFAKLFLKQLKELKK